MHVLCAGRIHKTSPAKYAYANNYVLNRKSSSKNVITRAAAGVISVVMAIGVVSVFHTDVAPTQAHAEPGTSGVPKAAQVLYKEDFQNASRLPMAITDYRGMNGQSFQAGAAWIPSYGGCNGWLLNSTSPMGSGDTCTTLIEYSSMKAGAHPAQVVIDGRRTVMATSTGGIVTTDGPITLNFASGTADPAHSTLSIDPRYSQVVGSVFTITARVHDVNDNVVEGAIVSFPPVSGISFVDDTSCTSGPDGACYVKVSSKLVGTYTISGSIGARSLANTVDAEFTVGPVCVKDCAPVNGANVTRVEVTLNGREADGVQRDVATAYGFDYYGNPVVGAAVQSVPAEEETSLTVQPDVAPLDKEGRTTIWYTATVQGSHKAEVSISELTPKGSPVTVSFGNGSGSTATSRWVISPEGPLTVGEDEENTYTATATVMDATSNLVPDALVTFKVNPAGPVFTPEATCVTGQDGECSVQLHSTKSGMYTVIAEIVAGGIINPETPDSQRTHVSVTQDNQTADGNARDIVTVFAFDVYGNPVDDVAFIFTTSHPNLILGRARAGAAVVTSDEEGTGELTTTSFQGGAYPASTYVDGVELIGHGSPLELRFLDKPVITSPTTGEVTKDRPTTVTGLGQNPGDLISVNENDSQVCTAIVSEDKTWSCTPETSFPDGEHTLVAKETDQVGNTSDPSKSVTITVDTLKPTAPIVDPSTGVTITGVTEPGTVVTVTGPDGETIEGCEAVQPDAQGRFICTPPLPLNPGDKVHVVATDKAGNVSDPTEVTIRAIMIDLAYPTRHAGENQTATGRFFIPEERVYLSMDNGGEIECRTVGLDGTVSFTFPTPRELGAHTVTLTGEQSGSVWTTFDTIIEVKTGGTVVRR